MSTKPQLIRMNAKKFNTSHIRFGEVSSWKIYTQGFVKFFYWILSFFTCCFFSNQKGEDDNLINVKRTERFYENDDFFGSTDIETGAVIDLNDENNEITDKVFRDACIEAAETCRKLAVGFLVIEKITKYCEIFVFCLFPVESYLGFSKTDFIISICVVTPMIILKVTCEWVILLEKYAKLSCDFSKLANSKEENRVEKYEDLVNNYRSSWFYSDNIKIKLI